MPKRRIDEEIIAVLHLFPSCYYFNRIINYIINNRSLLRTLEVSSIAVKCMFSYRCALDYCYYKKPSRQDIIKALTEQEACECLKEVKEKIKCAEEKVNNTQSNYDRYLNITDKKRKEDV